DALPISVGVLGEACDGPLEGDAEAILHPALVARADAEHAAAVGDLVEGVRLHRGEGDVARPRVDDPQPDPHPLGRRGHRPGDGEGAALQVVLAHPHLVEARVLGPAGELDGVGGAAPTGGGDTEPHDEIAASRAASSGAMTGTAGRRSSGVGTALSPGEVPSSTTVCSGVTSPRPTSSGSTAAVMTDEASKNTPSREASSRCAAIVASSSAEAAAPRVAVSAFQPCQVAYGVAIQKATELPA